MDANALARVAGKEAAPLAIVEKDFALSVILRAIAGSGLRDALVFKGGTAIKKAYFPEARFSEDLDFTVVAGNAASVENAVLGLFEGFKDSGVSIVGIERERSSAGLRMALKFTGPLSHPQRIRLDFSLRETVSAPPNKAKIIDRYGLGDCWMMTLCLEELLAEKLRAVSSRNAPRDLYDIWFLLNNGVNIDARLVERKLGIYNEKFDVGAVKARAGSLKAQWNADLQQFVRRVPSFEAVEQEVIERLRKEFPR
jgi:predicted nucleotidyltransferase component of viral defense system